MQLLDVFVPFRRQNKRLEDGVTGRGASLEAGQACAARERAESLSRYRRGFEIAGGLTLIVMGLYMLNAVLFWIPALA